MDIQSLLTQYFDVWKLILLKTTTASTKVEMPFAWEKHFRCPLVGTWLELLLLKSKIMTGLKDKLTCGTMGQNTKRTLDKKCHSMKQTASLLQKLMNT